MLKAQASLEQLVMIAIGLALVSFTFYIAINYSSDSTKISQAKDSVERLAASADHVYALGPNSKEYITIYLPDDLASASVNGRNIIITVPTTGGGTTDVYATSKAELIGSFPRYTGRQKVLVEYLLTGKVRIGEAGLACSPSTLTRAFDAGGSGADTIVISNNAEYNITNISASIAGTSLVAVGSPPASLLQGENGSLSVSYLVPAEQTSGTYGATVTVEAGNGGACTTQVTVNVNGVVSCASTCAAQGYSTGTCRAAALDCPASGEDYHPENDGACSGVPGRPSCCCWPSADMQGPLVSAINSTPNATSTTNVRIGAACNDTGRGNNFIASSDIQVDFGGWNAANPDGGSFSTAVVQNVYRDVGYLVGGQHIAAVRCTDTANNTGPISYYYFNVSAPDTLGPVILYMNHTDPGDFALADVVESGTATDTYTGGSNIQTCRIRLDSGVWHDAAASDGAYDSPSEAFSYNLGKLTAGSHTVSAYCVDSLGNIGGTFTDTFGVSPVDAMLAIERSGSMEGLVIDVSKTSNDNTGSTTFTLIKNLTLGQNGNPVNITAEIRSGSAGCIAYFEARVGSTVVASGSTSSTSYLSIMNQADLSAFSTPFDLLLYMKRSEGGSCTVYNRLFGAAQGPSRIEAARSAAKNFVDVTSNTTRMGLVSYATSATTDSLLLQLNTTANISALKAGIDAVTPSIGNICIACAIESGVAELESSRGRYPNATRAIILMTDGPGNVGNTILAATAARNKNVRVYTIGFGESADPVELQNIALLTNAEYYYAPDYTTLQYIYQHIGQ